jgi:Tfp pilus assembly protein PilV
VSARRGGGGFTVVEVIVAVVLLSVVALSLAGFTLYASRALRTSSAHLRAAEFAQAELERLLTVPYDALASGTRSTAQGRATWTVEDSVTYRRIRLVTEYAPTPAVSVWDTLVAYRTKP